MAGTDKTQPPTDRPRRNSRARKEPVVVKKVGPRASEGGPRGAGPRGLDDLQPLDRARPRRGAAIEDARGGPDGAGAPGAPARGGRRGGMVELPKSGAKVVGGPRNEHGTRVSRRVTCARCQTADHVPYVPKDPTKALCRTCAAEVLKTYEAGVRVRCPTRKTACNLCGAPFELPVSAEDDGDPLCPSCLRGFTSWQGSVDVPFAERGKAVVEERLSGALVRKRRS